MKPGLVPIEEILVRTINLCRNRKETMDLARANPEIRGFLLLHTDITASEFYELKMMEDRR